MRGGKSPGPYRPSRSPLKKPSGFRVTSSLWTGRREQIPISASSAAFPSARFLGITPFNFPLNLVAHKVAPALAAGNPILIKPAPQTPLTALLLGEVALEAGVPPGGLNVLPCDNQIAERLVVDPRFKLLSFTGSAAVGWMLKAKCGKKK